MPSPWDDAAVGALLSMHKYPLHHVRAGRTRFNRWTAGGGAETPSYPLLAPPRSLNDAATQGEPTHLKSH